MSAAFESGLRGHLESKPRLTLQDKRLLRVLDLPKNNPWRKFVLGQLEKTATAKLQQDGATAIDWSSIDWAKLLEQLLAFIKAILALFA